VTPGPEGDWRRLHPLTPLLRGGRSVLVVLTVLGSQGLRAVPSRGALVLLLLGAGLVAVAVGAVAWRTTRFRVAGGELQVDSGVLRRRARRVPLARVQSVDVVRPLAARLLGLAEVRLEVVGGGSTEAPLAFLAEADALALRLVLLGTAPRSAQAGAAAVPDVPPDERVLVRVPTWALVTSVLLGAPVVALVVAVPVLLLALGLDDLPAVVAAATPFALGVGGVAGRRVLAEYGSTVSEVPEGLRLRHGLLETRSQTVPPGRVQAVRVVEPLLWRRWGWVRVEVDVAGYAAGRREEASSTSVLLPVAPQALAVALVARVLGGDLPPADRPAPRRARLRAPLSWRRLRLGLDDRHLVTTSGVVRTTTDVVPLAKVQSLRLLQGPWQSRLRLATVVADTAGRRLASAHARHRDADEALALLEDLSVRARAARRSAASR
jgi:putative membrane protein